MRPDLESHDSSSVSLDPQLLQRLRELPDGSQIPYEFSEFSRRYSRRRHQATQRPLRLLVAAVAVVAAGWAMKHGLSPILGEVAAISDSPVSGIAAPGMDPGPPPRVATQWPVLLPTSNAERWLDEHPQRAVVRVPAQMDVTELEDQIAAMDDQLSAARLTAPHAQQLAMLQRDRAQLVESLAQVRYAQNLVAELQ
jgi:hypothetical protein